MKVVNVLRNFGTAIGNSCEGTHFRSKAFMLQVNRMRGNSSVGSFQVVVEASRTFSKISKVYGVTLTHSV